MFLELLLLLDST